MLVPVMSVFDLSNAITSKRPVFALFSARWCQNCASFKPTVRKWCAAHPDITAYEVDVERWEAVADANRIQSMPTFIAWQNGERVARHSGVMSENGFVKWAEKHLG